MPAHELGGGVHDHVRAEVERLLVERRREGAVDRDDRAVLPRGAADGRKVRDCDQGVRGRLDPEEVGGAGSLDPGRRVRRVQARGRPAPLFQALVDQHKK